eukprot:2729651-Rhodomonas_salina.2
MSSIAYVSTVQRISDSGDATRSRLLGGSGTAIRALSTAQFVPAGHTRSVPHALSTAHLCTTTLSQYRAL